MVDAGFVPGGRPTGIVSPALNLPWSVPTIPRPRSGFASPMIKPFLTVGGYTLLSRVTGFMHALLPFTFQHTGSDCISTLHERMILKRRRVAAASASTIPAQHRRTTEDRCARTDRRAAAAR